MDSEPAGPPHESDDSLESLLELPTNRRQPVRDFLTELVATCPYCGAEVRRSSARGIDADERLGCLTCVTAVEGTCSLCSAEVTRKHKRTELNGRPAHQQCADRQQRSRR